MFSSTAIRCSMFGLLLLCGSTLAAPLTPDAEVKILTLLRTGGEAPTVIQLSSRQVFLLNGQSTRCGDSIEIVFTKNGEAFRLHQLPQDGLPCGLFADFLGGVAGAAPLKGPATVTITGKGLVAYEVQKL